MIGAGLILGLASSFHCVGMCGPISLLIPVGKNKIALSLFLYHFGKLIAYGLIGVFFGLLVTGIQTFKMQAVFSIISGFILLFFAFIPPVLNFIEKRGYVFFNRFLQFKSKLTRALDKNKQEYSFYIGFLNGFLPCAMVYGAAIVALSQTGFLNSVFFMFLFGLGTIPLMVLFYYTAHFTQFKFAKYASIIRNFVFLLVGILLIYRGISMMNQEIPTIKIGENFTICLPF